MHSLLQRWLQKCHLSTNLSIRSSLKKPAEERSEPARMPTRHEYEELACEYAKFWTTIKDNDGQGLEEIQLDALTRWHAFRFDLGTSTDANPLPLDAIVSVFDDYFFVGSLRQYIQVEFVSDSPENSSWVGFTREKRRLISKPPQIQIDIKRPLPQLWTRALVQDLLDTLLHELSHAFLIIYSAPPGFLDRWRDKKIVDTEGLTGHGPCWVLVAKAIAGEADRALGGVWGRWDLKIEDSCRFEEDALDKSVWGNWMG